MHDSLIGFAGATSDRVDPTPGFDEEVFRRTAGAARNAFGWAFRAAMLLVLLAIPFALTMHRYPAQVRAEMAAAAQARAGAPPDGRQPAGSGPTIRPGPADPQPTG
jgi:ABC-type Fe3+ transport system permease subunit